MYGNGSVEGAKEADKACVAYEADPCNEPVTPPVTTKDPVTTIGTLTDNNEVDNRALSTSFVCIDNE